MRQQRIHGSCLCQAVKFSVALPVKWVAHCHCTRCQRAHGAGVVTWVGVAEQVGQISDASALLRWYRVEQGGERGFCGHCGSPMFFKSARWPGELHIARALFTEDPGQAPQMHAFHDSQVSWLTLADDDLPKKSAADFDPA
ncbi:MAG: GFA family protein [Lysobacterales bacterium]